MSDTDLELLARYTRSHARGAFSQVVRRHLDLVHSAALRQVRSPRLAEEVAQSTFIKLASHAHRLAPDTIVFGAVATLALAVDKSTDAKLPAGDSPISVSVAIPTRHGERRIEYGDRTTHFHVTVSNTSDKPQRIWREWCSWGYYELTFEFTDQRGKKWVAKKKPAILTRNFSDWWTLARVRAWCSTCNSEIRRNGRVFHARMVADRRSRCRQSLSSSRATSHASMMYGLGGPSRRPTSLCSTIGNQKRNDAA